jgi:ABC-type multidrug transport system ATPase subunit
MALLASGHDCSFEQDSSNSEPAWLVQARRFAPRINGTTTEIVHLADRPLLVGRHPDCDVLLADAAVAPCHAVVARKEASVYLRRAPGGGETLVNGRPIEQTCLLPGDRMRLGPYTFVFEGDALTCIEYPRALTVAAVRLHQRIGHVTQLAGVTLLIQPGEFVGILGPSGAGKTTLLEAFSGVRPARDGEVLINGEPLYRHGEALRPLIGYVPQDDILHRELTCRQAWRYAAQLRLPGDVPAAERDRLVEEMLATLDLTERANVPIGKLSGGQRKRANVGVELLSRPGILFLDEPTAGLDPGTETRLMRKFKELASRRQTVVCTTHVVENVDLFDKVVVLAPGGVPAYFGSPAGAQAYFGIRRFTELYDRLEEQPPQVWYDRFAASSACESLQRQLAEMQKPHPVWRWSATPHPSPGGGHQSLILLRRFCRILSADRRNLAMLLAQPLAISGLICLVYSDLPRILFLLVVAMLWFGCSTAAQQLVKERPVFRRERMVNLNLPAYVLSKFLPLAVLAVGQCMLMLFVVWLFRGGGLSRPVLLGLALTACSATALGLIVSALAGNADKATSAVPLVMLPQIILAGVLVALPDMSLLMRSASHVILARWANGIMEATLLDGRRVDVDLLTDPNLARSLRNQYPDYDLSQAADRRQFRHEYSGTYLDQRGPMRDAYVILTLFLGVQLTILIFILRRQHPA